MSFCNNIFVSIPSSRPQIYGIQTSPSETLSSDMIRRTGDGLNEFGKAILGHSMVHRGGGGI